ncbi:MAG: SDR family oxidoreductase [Rubrivivax sp.]|jgi:3-oxoacyl-[acyl-carrier protein] reductase|nr:SDR family oxidoreductase [Rubrivivax sp.]
MTTTSDQPRRVALITGAASGIGAATARRFLREGWQVVINHLDGQQDAAQAVAAGAGAPGQRAIGVVGDVTLDADCVRLVQEAVDAFGRLDVLVNAAGISKMVPHDRLHDISAEDFQRIYAVNTIGPFQMIRAAAPALKAASTESQRSAVVNVSSRAALMGSGSSMPYACSKAAVNALTLSMARVLAPAVRVNAVCPALTEQGFVERLAPESFAQRRAHQIQVSPLHRIGHPDEVAESIHWLATAASMMTGALVELDFGMHLNAV